MGTTGCYVSWAKGVQRGGTGSHHLAPAPCSCRHLNDPADHTLFKCGAGLHVSLVSDTSLTNTLWPAAWANTPPQPHCQTRGQWMKIPQQRVPRGKGPKLGHWTTGMTITGAAVPLLTLRPCPFLSPDVPKLLFSGPLPPGVPDACLWLGRAALVLQPRATPCGARLVRPGSWSGHRAASFPDSRGRRGRLLPCTETPFSDTLVPVSGLERRQRVGPCVRL